VSALLERLRGGLIVSVQAEAESVLNTPEAIVLLARCAIQNGAVGVRVEGEARISAVRAALPGAVVIGLLKYAHEGFEPYITSTRAEIAAVAHAGAQIVAFDATSRPRADRSSVAWLTAEARARGVLAMADCSGAEDAALAIRSRADIVATTLAGYTPATRGRGLPALDLAASIAARHPFAVCEGGVATPEQLRAAFEAGASAVVVGTEITNIDLIVRRFAAAAPRSKG
jgi:N-acylglucosamine-6-phosphate 2-epimerase